MTDHQDLTPAEIAAIYGIGESTARRWTAGLTPTGVQPKRGRGRRANTYSREDVAAVAKARGGEPAPRGVGDDQP